MGIHLVTGITGFLGSRLAKQLVAKGHTVLGLKRESSSLDHLKYCGIEGQVELHDIDPLNFDLNKILDRRGLEATYHTAALSRASEDLDNLKEIVSSNITFPLLLANQAKALGCTSFINASSFWQSIEGDGYKPFNQYAASKQCFEDFLTSLASDKFACISLRVFDTYGAGDTRGRVIDLLFKAIFSGEALSMSPGEQSMSLVHIEDVARAFVMAGELAQTGKVKSEQIFSIYNEELTPLKELAATIGKVANLPVPIEWGGRPYRPNEIMKPLAGHENVPGWKTEVRLEDGLKEMLSEYK